LKEIARFHILPTAAGSATSKAPATSAESSPAT
jgi:hypothetical protein